MAEYSKLATGSFTTGSSITTQVVYLPFAPTSVRLTNATAFETPAQNVLTRAFYSSLYDPNVSTAMEYISAASNPWTIAVDSVATPGIVTFQAGLSFQFGAQIQVASTTKATNTITTASPHGYSTGDTVILQGLYQSSSTGFAQICGMPFVITVTGATTFTINWDCNQSNFTNLSGSPSGAYVMKVLYPFLYAPGQSFVSAVSLGSQTTITTTCAHNFVVGQEIGFLIPQPYGTTQLNTLPNTIIPGNPKYYIVTSVTSATQFVCNAVSSSFTAFNSNQPISYVPQLQYPQVFAIGTYNTGSLQYSGGALYPSPVVNGVSTINGPAIVGSFVANTRQGFAVQQAVGSANSSVSLLAANSTYVWESFYYDLGNP